MLIFGGMLAAVQHEERSLLISEAAPATALAAHPPAVRGRLWRLLAVEAGCPEVTAAHVRALDALVTQWHGQGPTYLPGGIAAVRRDGGIRLQGAGTGPAAVADR